jgi:4a-hydroxytetrahydrobiopterin dehydratase
MQLFNAVVVFNFNLKFYIQTDMSELKDIKCVPCRGSVDKVQDGKINEYLQQLPDWNVVEANGIKQLRRSFTFDNFALALKFTNRIGAIAEEEDHHPEIITEWGKVTVTWWTHKIKGLHLNDFIMAAKTDELLKSR